jgi:type VI secretion system secreted protein Hcp
MNFRRLATFGALVAAIAMPLAANADNMFLKVTGQKSGLIKGGVIQKGREDSMKVTEYSYSIVSPRDPASGLPTGKRMHKPFVITMELDKASPLLFNALATNENLTTVELHLFRPTMGAMAGTGVEALTMMFKLTNANIASFSYKTVEAAGKAPVVMVEVAFTFQKIEMTWVNGGITAIDDWEARV